MIQECENVQTLNTIKLEISPFYMKNKFKMWAEYTKVKLITKKA